MGFASNTIVPLHDGSNISVTELELHHNLIDDNQSDCEIIEIVTTKDYLFRIEQDHAMTYEVSNSHILCLIKTDFTKVNIALDMYLLLSKHHQALLYGYKQKDKSYQLSTLTITPTHKAKVYNINTVDNKKFILADGTVVSGAN